jgi:membrane fusion protein (multidrug efflux system)
MADPLPPTPLDPYRHGYREGFRDGVAETRQERVTPPAPPPAARDTPAEAPPPKDGDAEQKGTGKDRHAKDQESKPFYKRPWIVLLLFVVLLAAILAAIVFWRHSRHHETTDDAFIDGRASTVAAQTGGRVLRLLANDNQAVHAGDLLLEIDPRDANARVAQARAQLANAESQLATARAQVDVRRAAATQSSAATRQDQVELAKAERDAGRYANVDPDAVARQQTDAAGTAAQSARARLDAAHGSDRSARAQIDAALTQVRTAEAGIEAARAELAAAELQLSYTRVVAPVDGHVTHRAIEVGNVVSAGQPLLSIVGMNLWVTANYKETQLTRMQPGQGVEVTVDAFPDLHFRAHVDSIQRGTGAFFSMLPAENATGNYVKVTQRVPVKIVFDDDRLRNYPIGPGMSATPDVSLP